MRGLGGTVSTALAVAQPSARSFGSTLTDAFTTIVVKGKDVGYVIASLGQRLSGLALNVALKPIEQGITGVLNQALGGVAFANGGVLQGGQVRAFADGGVVSAPTYFPMASGVGLMGERGAEAIMPLARGADGALGVRMQGESGGSTVQVNISTPNPAAFRQSDAYVSGLVARAVARGQRSL